ncbi:unnamed protein product [Durusdinium trenchii]
MDLAIVEEGNSKIAVSLMDNVVKTFDLGTGEEIPVDETRKSIKSPPMWEFDAVEKVERDYASTSVLTAYDRYVFVGTTAPSLQIWRRPLASRHGHNDFVPPPLPPLELRQRCLPLALNAHDVPPEACLADPILRPGMSLQSARQALEADRNRWALRAPHEVLKA